MAERLNPYISVARLPQQRANCPSSVCVSLSRGPSSNGSDGRALCAQITCVGQVDIVYFVRHQAVPKRLGGQRVYDNLRFTASVMGTSSPTRLHSSSPVERESVPRVDHFADGNVHGSDDHQQKHVNSSHRRHLQRTQSMFGYSECSWSQRIHTNPNITPQRTMNPFPTGHVASFSIRQEFPRAGAAPSGLERRCS